VHKVGNKAECNNMHGERIKAYKDKLTLCACELDAKIRATSFLVFFNDLLNGQDYETSNHGILNP